jgi:hypothetical protein
MGKIIDQDIIEIIVDRNNLSGSINLIGHGQEVFDSTWGSKEISKRPNPTDLAPHPQLPDDSRLWAALQSASGGTWGGCVYDVDSIIEVIEAGKKALSSKGKL